MRLFHVSENENIGHFEPRHHETWPDLAPGVWVIGESHIRNYLLPRECPRVTFCAHESSSSEDVDKYLGGDMRKSVVAVEEAWVSCIHETGLFLYEFEPDGFEVFDEGAGYFRAERTVRPVAVHPMENLANEIELRGAEFRTLPSLWPLLDCVIPSTLQFSMIRMRNAAPREEVKPEYIH